MIKGILRPKCQKGIHDMNFFSSWTRPSDGARYCKECMRETRRRHRGTLADGSDEMFDPSLKEGNRTDATPIRRYKENRWYNESTGRRILWTDLFPMTLPQVFEKACQTLLQMSTEEFLAKWDNNYWPDPDMVSGVTDVASFIYMVRPKAKNS